MRREVAGIEVGESEVADFLTGLGVFEESENSSFVELPEVFLGLVGAARLPVSEVRKSFECGCTGRHPLGPELLERDTVACDVEQLIVAFLAPILERVLVKEVEVFCDLRL